jgi:hypothetical protein
MLPHRSRPPTPKPSRKRGPDPHQRSQLPSPGPELTRIHMWDYAVDSRIQTANCRPHRNMDEPSITSPRNYHRSPS